MAGTRTAPAATATPTKFYTTLYLIDASGDTWAETIVTEEAPTAANFEAWAAAYQAGSQASLYALGQNTLWEGAALASNAETDQRSTVAEGINLLMKELPLNSETLRLIAPVPTAMTGNSDIPIVASGPVASVINAGLLVLNSGIVPGEYLFRSAQFTGRRERKNNPRVSL